MPGRRSFALLTRPGSTFESGEAGAIFAPAPLPQGTQLARYARPRRQLRSPACYPDKRDCLRCRTWPRRRTQLGAFCSTDLDPVSLGSALACSYILHRTGENRQQDDRESRASDAKGTERESGDLFHAIRPRARSAGTKCGVRGCTSRRPAARVGFAPRSGQGCLQRPCCPRFALMTLSTRTRQRAPGVIRRLGPLDLYSHMMPGMRADVAEQVDAALQAAISASRNQNSCNVRSKRLFWSKILNGKRL